MLLSAGDKGKRYMTPHATAMLHQPRVPSTGERQATELSIKWRETQAQKRVLLNILSQTTGHEVTKLEKVRSSAACTVLNILTKFISGYAASAVHDRKGCYKLWYHR
jgi:ATP-dependent protease ClpP protease subunit